MSKFKFVVASALMSGSIAVAGAARADEGIKTAGIQGAAGQCEARILRAETEFPKAAQDRGEGGTVRVRVVLNGAGTVVDSKVVESSGSRVLDHAAVKSVAADWRFDVAHCISTAVPVTQDVNVVYKRVPKSFSASVNRQALKNVRQAAASDQCTVVPIDSGSHVISCIERATPGGIAASGLAQREPESR